MDEFSRLTLGEITRLADERRLPPVERWDPPHCGPSFMRIDRDGGWYHEGRPIRRPELVRLFASILRREPDGSYVLVTPVEKLTIDVEDAPFVAVEMRNEGEGRERALAFRLNTGEIVLAGPGHRLRLDGTRPYLEARRGLDALIARAVWYELAELALGEGGVWSGGTFFPIGGGG
jgi:uncharacterized protein